jgi:EAL and modified HD-GYP domain-containing signal transduction protein
MAAPVRVPERAPGGSPDAGVEVRYVARQPIMDMHGKVHGYELLFRNGPVAAFSGDLDDASRTMLDNAALFGLKRLTRGLPAFVNCTTETLTSDLVHILPSGMTVLEILESLEPTPALIEACSNLKSAGFRLALDDFTWKPGFDPLIELADYVKVDFVLTDRSERRKLLNRLQGLPLALVAEKIETQEEFQQAKEEGFSLVQGYYFCRPVLLENNKVPANKLSQIQILRRLQEEAPDLRELAGLVKRDTSLTYRLLRMINSPACAMQQEVRSIETALIAIGEENFRRLATLAITSELNKDQPMELLRMAFLRARFCELAAAGCGLNSTEQYLLGLMSLLPAMLRRPMEELVPALPLRKEIREALLGEQSQDRCTLTWLEGHELGDWDLCDDMMVVYKMDRENLLRSYDEAAVWAEEALHSS